MKYYIPIYIILLFSNPIFSQKGKIQRANDVFQKQDYNLSRTLYSEVLQNSQKENYSYRLYYQLAYAAMQTGEFEMAHDNFQKIKEELGISSYYNYDYAQCLIALGKYEEAKQQIIKYFNNEPYYYSKYTDFVDHISNLTDTALIFKDIQKRLLVLDKFSYNKIWNELNRPLFLYKGGLVIYEDLFYDYKNITDKFLIS